MPDEVLEKKETPEYTDFITFKPETVKFLNKQQMDLSMAHISLLRALRNNHMTAKEIHNLYKDPETQKFSCTLKTVYRYLEKLEKEGLIAVAGHRIMEGSQIAGKIYSRTAILFFPKQDEEHSKWWETDEGKELAQKLNTLVAGSFQIAEADESRFYDFLKKLSEAAYQIMGDLLEKAKESERLASAFIEGESLEYLTIYASILIAFMRQPELLEQLQKNFF
ncbi:MAG: transcriptional repressor [Candidatus Hodarchaeota archaeon]